MNDLTILYYTANREPEGFAEKIRNSLKGVIGNTPVISVSQHPVDLGKNVCLGDMGMSLYNLYYQILVGLREVKTPFVAMAEDDTVYSSEHFKYRPPAGVVGYDLNKWAIFTWRPSVFSKRTDRRVMSMCIGDTKVLLHALTQRYEKYPYLDMIPPDIYKYYWGEPGRFEDHLGIDKVATEKFECAVPSVTFFTEHSLGFTGLGKRKALGPIQTENLAPYGNAKEVYESFCNW